MNVSSREICQQLHRLSGWENVDNWRLVGFEHLWSWSTVKHDLPENRSPAYDLGFLLRNVPPVIRESHVDYYFSLEAMDDGSFTASYGFVEPGGGQIDAPSIPPVWAQDPEDAVAKLAIKLLEAGVLTRGEA